MSEENSKATCKQCKQEVVKIFSYIEKNLTRRFRNSSGGLWMGKLCPDCYRESQKAKMAERAAGKPSHTQS